MKAVVIGRSGSGKSDLIQKLAQAGTPIIREQAREILREHEFSDAQTRQIAMMTKQEYWESHLRNFVSDRGLHDYFIYSQRVGLDLYHSFGGLQNRYTHVFLLPPRPFKRDGVRIEKDEQEATEIQETIEGLYELTGHNLIRVPTDEQLKFILEAIKNGQS
jgi:predicted ATPase